MQLVAVEFPVIFFLIAALYWVVPYTSQNTIRFGVRIPPNRMHDPILVYFNALYRKRLEFATISIFFALIVVPTLFGAYQIELAAIFSEIIFAHVFFVLAHHSLARVKKERGWYQGIKEAAGIIILENNSTDRGDKIYSALLAMSALIIAATAIMGALMDSRILAQINILAEEGEATGLVYSSSLLNAFSISIAQTFLTALLALLSYVIMRSRQELEVFRPRTSYVQQYKFKRYTRYTIMASSIMINISFLLIAIIGWGLLNKSYSSLISYLPLSSLLVFFLPMILLGQQGSHIKVDFEEDYTSLANRNDDQYWKGGIFYFNPGDSSFVVANRFGVGWSMNFGNPLTWVVISFVVVGFLLTGVFFNAL
ncbi:MAG: DUF5808 domain-containing protein [Thermoplasmataceae archaeon]